MCTPRHNHTVLRRCKGWRADSKRQCHGQQPSFDGIADAQTARSKFSRLADLVGPLVLPCILPPASISLHAVRREMPLSDVTGLARLNRTITTCKLQRDFQPMSLRHLSVNSFDLDSTYTTDKITETIDLLNGPVSNNKESSAGQQAGIWAARTLVNKRSTYIRPGMHMQQCSAVVKTIVIPLYLA